MARLVHQDFFQNSVSAWQSLRLTELLYSHYDAAVFAVLGIATLSMLTLIGRAVFRGAPERSKVAVPALLDWSGQSGFSFIRHAPLLLVLAGLTVFALALADPYTAISRQEVTYPGRRIALMIDASSSMMARFPSTKLNTNTESKATFFTTVGAAQVFVKGRMSGKYRDLISLIEFGDEAYVVTPFTNDYDNILLSLSLIDDWQEFLKFPDQGTTIGLALDEAINLFRAFDFLDASGNLLVIFSDGQDTQALVNGRKLDDILAGATKAKIPVYFIRASYNRGLGGVIPDQIWKPAVEKTGGKFYAASDEATILQAVHEIDRLSAGTVAVKQYVTETPRFAPFALAAAGLWALALVAKLTIPNFQKFP